ncbi:flagellar motor switch protein FliN [Thioalkalivibrio sp. XN279]|uniref:flagellar motor switch protein FliN n=1 Tax=Thioalkalivibrio sp. XN279 TaxID=2714953 RepID=UPI00140C6A4D|nr:flagellar motor switch protein FliN [Thioalkalivibrio sp. XN279]NHA13360.1 flagellar motor switch protein FliN [Thioalkalivibrio sp. XN279]
MSEQNSAAMDDWAAAMAEQAVAEQAVTANAGRQAGNGHKPPGNGAGQPVTPAALEASGGPGNEDVNLEVVLDIPVTLSMEIGRAKVPIRNLLQLNQGSVVELERLVGEPMDVLVNGTLIAHGEVVVINEKYGIRLTDVISPAERVRKLR